MKIRKSGALIAAVALMALVLPMTALANIPGSTFEGGDGNLAVDTVGNTDWTNVTNKTSAADLATGANDNSFGQGTSENDVNIHVGTGSIPNSKADLGRFASAFQFIGGNLYLQLAWTRNNLSGTTNFDFEINQAAQPDLTTVGDKTLVRTAGDLLVTYDFLGGAQKPTLGIRTWTGSVWGPATTINAAVGEAEVNRGGSVSTTSIGGGTVPAFAFGEANINLTAAGVVPANACEGFSSIYVKSRSSDSFSAALKDFIAPTPVNISNCGTVTIIKQTNPAGLDQNFGYTSNLTSGTGSPDTTPAAFTLNDGADATDSEQVINVPIGTYNAIEGADPSGFHFASVSCTHTGSGTGAQDAVDPRKVNIGIVAGGDTVTCTYINDQNLGAILVTKTRKHAADGAGSHPQSGVTFTVDGVSKQTNASGQACFDGLTFGSHDVTETLPTGYSADQALTQAVNVDTNTTCAVSPYVGETVSFGNTPLSDITITINSDVDGGTSSSVVCVDANGDPYSGLGFTTGTNGDGTDSDNNIEPIELDCHISIDP